MFKMIAMKVSWNNKSLLITLKIVKTSVKRGIQLIIITIGSCLRGGGCLWYAISI